MKKILFITGTRADYGKLKPLMKAVEKHDDFELYVYVSGMHVIEKFGGTYNEVLKDNYKNVFVAFGVVHSENMSVNLGNMICDLTGYAQHVKPDLIVVHGDRIDALCGAVVGAFNNIMVAHIEGGEVSGTIDDSIRHAISKFAHLHFVSNHEAKQRLIQLGEGSNDIHVIGSPDIDIMISETLPSIAEAKSRYDIKFDNYGIFMFHPVTTEYKEIGEKVEIIMEALKESGRNFIAIYPNNDTGSDIILNQLWQEEGNQNFALYSSIRFEYFLTFLKNAQFIIGNSSAGVRESCVYGVPSIDIGSRQNGRYDSSVLKNIVHVNENKNEILDALNNIENKATHAFQFGDGKSKDKFMKVIMDEEIWERNLQKTFVDLSD
ncbi:MAG: UDP-N-acetylglucosamine 2-epimerase (hydrolyzing) [Peptostreptococcaceae bacterium]|nr:UDP-N-acetylglucosamine 2-epimerase (hydrolyzing) [Peptostreptococcaceae bacterium]